MEKKKAVRAESGKGKSALEVVHVLRRVLVAMQRVCEDIDRAFASNIFGRHRTRMFGRDALDGPLERD